MIREWLTRTMGVRIGARRGWQPGAAAPPPWNLKVMTSYAVPVEDTLKFSFAPRSLASNTLKLSLKRRKIAKVSFAPSARQKQVIFASSRGFASPLWKNPAGALGLRRNFSREGKPLTVKKSRRVFIALYKISTIFRCTKGANVHFCVF